MSKEKPENQESLQAWNTYWEGISGDKAFGASGVRHPGFGAFWTDALAEFLGARPDANILDMATGSGVVIEHLSRVSGADLKNVSCVDSAQAAVAGVAQRFPDVTGVVADIRDIPIEPGKFDLITSQFGVEYGGDAAVDEAVRLLAPGGHLIFLLHVESGALQQRTLAAVDALRRVREADFVNLALSFFEAGFAAVRGAERDAYDSAAKRLNPAIGELEAVMTEHGEDVADGTIIYLYNTVKTMHSRIQYYDADEGLNWLRAMADELQAHENRMLSMNAAALDREGVEAIRANLVKKGLMPSQAEPLLFEGDPLPFAWVLQAANPG